MRAFTSDIVLMLQLCHVAVIVWYFSCISSKYNMLQLDKLLLFSDISISQQGRRHPNDSFGEKITTIVAIVSNFQICLP